MDKCCVKSDDKLKVINLGLKLFYDSVFDQGVKVTNIEWKAPIKHSEKLTEILLKLKESNISEKIKTANEKAVSGIVDSDPAWVDILPAIDVIDGMEDYMVLHSGPPIDYSDMVMLHRRGLVSACLFEGWAKTEEEAIALIESGKIKSVSALDKNTVGAGTGIITKSVAMIVTEDRRTGRRAATFPAEGPFQGGFLRMGSIFRSYSRKPTIYA